MEITKFNIGFMDTLGKDLNMLRHSISSSLAHQISDSMANEYQYVIDKFYSEYDPEYYARHSERGMRPGLNKTFKRVYKNPHNTIYYGGIEIDSERMYDDYRDSKEDVLNSFLEGYHGRPSAGVKSSLLPYKYMIQFRQDLINKLRRSDSQLLTDAKNKAKGLPYQLIKII